MELPACHTPCWSCVCRRLRCRACVVAPSPSNGNQPSGVADAQYHIRCAICDVGNPCSARYHYLSQSWRRVKLPAGDHSSAHAAQRCAGVRIVGPLASRYYQRSGSLKASALTHGMWAHNASEAPSASMRTACHSTATGLLLQQQLALYSSHIRRPTVIEICAAFIGPPFPSCSQYFFHDGLRLGRPAGRREAWGEAG